MRKNFAENNSDKTKTRTYCSCHHFYIYFLLFRRETSTVGTKMSVSVSCAILEK